MHNNQDQALTGAIRLTVIISYYKAQDNLRCILKALSVQSNKHFEVIISEDDNNPDTPALVSEFRQRYSFPIHHIHQDEDLGFRKNKMLNRALLLSHSDSIAFIDGDCIPHKHFVKEYIRNMKTGIFLSGRSVMMGEQISQTIRRHQAIHKLNFFSLAFTDSKKTKEGIYSPLIPLYLKDRGLVGRNWGIHKQHLLDINGFDEDYERAGVGEDVDIEWRLLASGIKNISIKNKAIVFHLYHKQGYSEDGVKLNFDMLDEKKKAGHLVCLNGIRKNATSSLSQ